jgi:PAS domain S-box-containing protein
MDQTETAGSGPLANYYRRYGTEQRLVSYARGRCQQLWIRQLFLVIAFSLLASVVPPLYAAMAFLLAVSGDLLDCVLLRRLEGLIARGVAISRLRLLTSVTALLHAITFSIAALAPYWIHIPGLPEHTHNEPLFTVGLLAGAAMNTGLVYSYHPRAVQARLAVFGLVPIVLQVYEILTLPTMILMHSLHLGGLTVLYGSFFWFLVFVRRSFERNRNQILSQALQQQELEGAYARLSEQQQEARNLAAVARNANDSVMLMDATGRITWVNDSFTRLSGYSFDEAVGELPGDLLNGGHTDPGVIKLLDDSIRHATPVRAEVRNRRKDGAWIWIETSQVPMVDRNGKVETVIAVERDITQAKEHARQLEEARVAAEEGARAKAEFLATMSHEIRTPMNGVMGMAQLLRDTPLSEEQAEYSDAILGSADTLLALIDDVLDFSRMEAGQVAFSPAEFDPAASFRTTVQLLSPQARSKGLELSLELPDNLPGQLWGDNRRIQQILMNLLGNAIKFTATGQVSVTLDTRPNGPNTELTFSVTDTGIGIDAAHLDRVFERFSQADAAISRQFGGTGLGLAISRRLAPSMQGDISVTSTPGKGSCFTVQLQLAPPPAGTDTVADSQPAPLASAPQEPPMLDGLRVLVAEDNNLNRLLVERFLRSSGIELAFAEDGHDALEQFQTFGPSIILMDMSMPGMDGLEATRRIRALPQPQPVIVALTANAFDSDREACIAAGMDDFMSKPVSRGKLLALLARLAPKVSSTG